MPDKENQGTKRTPAKDEKTLSSHSATEGFIPPHGGYEQLLSFQKARIVYDGTVRFCDRFINKRSRTHDQMVQAARSGKQNILEGSQASGTSKETEIKLTNYLLDQQLRRLEQDFLNDGGLRERMTRARLQARDQQRKGRGKV